MPNWDLVCTSDDSIMPMIPWKAPTDMNTQLKLHLLKSWDQGYTLNFVLGLYYNCITILWKVNYHILDFVKKIVSHKCDGLVPGGTFSIRKC